MLIWNRKNKNILVSGILFFFLGGLLPLSCVHCLTDAEYEQHMIAGNESHCSHMVMDNEKTEPVKSKKPCKDGLCDCKHNNKITRDDRTQTIKANTDSSINVYPVVHELAWPGSLTLNDQPANLKPYKPDRACYPPLERTCVLLN